MNWLRRLYIRILDRHDPAAVMQTLPTPTERYDYLKARRAALKAKTRTATGRKYQRPQKPVDNVVPMRGRKQA